MIILLTVMRLAIMQPYFLPYLGYWQLLNAVDAFVLYDNIKYTKKGWINRNRILSHGKIETVSLPLTKSSDFDQIFQKKLVPNFSEESDKLKRKIVAAYAKAPCFIDGQSLFEASTPRHTHNLFEFLIFSIKAVAQILGIQTQIIPSSKLPLNHELKGQERVLEICKYFETDTYINPPGGRSLYSHLEFKTHGIELLFLDPKIKPYSQLEVCEFIENLSILDICMNKNLECVQEKLCEYEIFS